MIRKQLLMGALLLSLTACERPVIPDMVSVQVQLSGFTVTQEPITPTPLAQTRAPLAQTRAPQSNTRATDIATETAIKILDLAFFDTDGTLVKQLTQDRNDPTSFTTFGTFTCELPPGNYRLVAVGRGSGNGDVFTIDSPTEAGYTSERARETLVATRQLDIPDYNPVTIDLTLQRVVAKLQIVSLDNRTPDFAKVRTTYAAGGKRFNPATGLTLTNEGFSVTNTPSLVYNTPIDVASYVFLAADEQNMDVTIETLDNNNQLLAKRILKAVPMRRNRCTKLTGNLFSNLSSFTLKVEDWLPEHLVNF